jgi:hypothetical protein
MSVFIPDTNGVNLQSTISQPATSDFTAMCWAMLSTTGAGSRTAVSVEPNLTLGVNGTTLQIGSSNLYTGSVLPSSVWLHIAMTCFSNGSASNHVLQGYLNGELNITPNTDTSTYAAFTGLTVGNKQAAGSNAQPFSGNIRDVRVWSRLLTITEIRAEMLASHPMKPQALVAWYPLDIDLAYDRSGNGHLLTATGTGQLQQAGPLKPWPARASNHLR